MDPTTRQIVPYISAFQARGSLDPSGYIIYLEPAFTSLEASTLQKAQTSIEFQVIWVQVCINTLDGSEILHRVRCMKPYK